MKRSRIIFTLAMALTISLTSFADSGEEDNPLSPYPSPGMMVVEIYELAKAHPDRIEVMEYGKSVEGRPLLVMRISRPGGEDRPAAWIGACIHGNEWIGNRMAMAVARMLVEDDGRDSLVTEALDAMDFYIAPCINPDGYQKTWEMPHAGEIAAEMGATLTSSTGDQGTGWAYCRKNANGVDLNRNWPIPGKVTIPIDWAGSPDPSSVHYRGPEPLSEPETRAIDRLFQEHPEIFAAISWHSTGAVQFPAHCPSRACMKRHKKMCKAFKDNQPNRGYPRLQTRVFDSYTGEMEDWLYAEYGVLAMDVEISKSGLNRKACGCDSLFWSFNPIDPSYWIENDARAAIAAMLEAEKTTGGIRITRGER
jgi:hypothetical protein